MNGQGKIPDLQAQVKVNFVSKDPIQKNELLSHMR